MASLGDIVSGTFDWVGDKLGDTVDWVREDPLEALAVAAVVYGGYYMATQAAAPASAGVVGEAGASTVGATEGVTAAESLAIPGSSETVAGMGEGLLGVEPIGSSSVLAPAGTDGVLAAAAPTGVAEGTAASDMVAGMTPTEMSGTVSNYGSGSLAPGAANAAPVGTNSVLEPVTQGSEAFWSTDNPYAWMVGGQGVSSAANMWSGHQQREDEKEREGRKNYYGVSNSGSRSDSSMGSVGEGMLSVNSQFSSNRSRPQGYRPQRA